MSNETVPIIEITDPNLQQRVDQAIADLEAHYPDKKIKLLDTVDKNLGKRLSALYKLIGYDSRADFCVAYGFELIVSRGGGRPATVDPEAVLTELESRYKDRTKPSTIKQLSEQNPDLKGKIKTITNASTKHFGKRFSDVLLERGILEAPTLVPVDDDAIVKAVDALTEAYAATGTPASSATKLRNDNPEYFSELIALSDRCPELFGCNASELLFKRGLIASMPKTQARKASSKKDFTREEIDAAVKEYRDIVYALPCEERPSKQADIKALAPDLAPAIIFGIRKDPALKEELRATATLYSSPSFIWNNGVRGFAFDEINPLVAKLIGKDVVEPGDPESVHLPRYVTGIDLVHKMELRELSLCCKTSNGYEPGQEVEFTEDTEDVTDWRGRPVHQLHLCLPNMYKSSRSWNFGESTGVICDLPNPLDAISDDFRSLEASPLHRHIKAIVTSCVEHGAQHYTTVLLQFLMPLKNETVASLLRGMGIVTNADIQGDLAWRYRLRQAAESKPTF